MNTTFLLLIRGLGGTGKTTTSQLLSKQMNLPLLNRDDIKCPLRKYLSNESDVVDAAYDIMNQLAEVQLQNNVPIILDANARFKAMEGLYLNMCNKNMTILLVVNLFCGDHDKWKARIESRGHSHPHSFEETRDMKFEKFETLNQISFDTTKLSNENICDVLSDWIKNKVHKKNN